jgi:hypothetical protein
MASVKVATAALQHWVRDVSEQVIRMSDAAVFIGILWQPRTVQKSVLRTEYHMTKSSSPRLRLWHD